MWSIKGIIINWHFGCLCLQDKFIHTLLSLSLTLLNKHFKPSRSIVIVELLLKSWYINLFFNSCCNYKKVFVVLWAYKSNYHTNLTNERNYVNVRWKWATWDSKRSSVLEVLHSTSVFFVLTWLGSRSVLPLLMFRFLRLNLTEAVSKADIFIIFVVSFCEVVSILVVRNIFNSHYFYIMQNKISRFGLRVWYMEFLLGFLYAVCF